MLRMIKILYWQGWAVWVAAEGVTVDLALLIDRSGLTVMGLLSQSPVRTEGL